MSKKEASGEGGQWGPIHFSADRGMVRHGRTTKQRGMLHL